MPFIFYLLLINLPVLFGIAIVAIISYKKRNPVQLYSEGLRNENNGFYKLAVQNYECALIENRKLNISKKFDEKIVQRIKILQSTIDFERNFQDGRGQKMREQAGISPA